MAVVERTYVVPQRGQGRPDYSAENHRAKTIYGYNPIYGEAILMALIEAVPAPGAYNFTRVAINPAETVDLLNPVTGLPGITMGANRDYIIKQYWCNFDQPMMFVMLQEAVGDDYSCIEMVPASPRPSVQAFPIGWARSQIEPIGAESTTRIRVTNLGSRVALGKAWIQAFCKDETYTWF